ncbi:transcriptional regulator [Actinotalea sp. BY-33]|uniref:Transcriptional regulator n=1 Tax=Actinotalea soli TaxID=2819234 RepID=A0A939RUW5_9CELL|nr:transcriptional regulator [Actinotalea soli]
MAWPAGADPHELAVRTRRAHEAFLGGRAGAPVRQVVLDSWRRSRRSGVDPEHPRVEVDLTGRGLVDHRDQHPLAAALPVVRRALLEGPGTDGVVVALGDAAGRLLWVEGDRGVRRRLDGAGFVEGSCWLEGAVGTSAPGIALATDHEVQVFAAEHFSLAVQPWSCSAAPVHDPTTGAVLGVLDLTGGDQAAAPHMMALVRATVMAVEAQLALAALRAPAPPGRPGLTVLGRTTGRVGGVDLTLRHAEILLLLSRHPEGLGAEELAVLLHPGEVSVVTVRAEISRLRRAVGPLLGGSRPYRLAGELTTDLDLVRARLDRGDAAGAVAAYAGPVLPRSQAPGVVALREELAAEMAAALEATDDAAALGRWTRSPAGSEHWSAWRRLADLEPPGSCAAVRAEARRSLLDRRLA